MNTAHTANAAASTSSATAAITSHFIRFTSGACSGSRPSMDSQRSRRMLRCFPSQSSRHCEERSDVAISRYDTDRLACGSQ